MDFYNLEEGYTYLLLQQVRRINNYTIGQDLLQATGEHVYKTSVSITKLGKLIPTAHSRSPSQWTRNEESKYKEVQMIKIQISTSIRDITLLQFKVPKCFVSGHFATLNKYWGLKQLQFMGFYQLIFTTWKIKSFLNDNNKYYTHKK